MTVAFTATDADAGVDYTEYSLDGGTTWTQGVSVTIVADPLAHATDGEHVILYRSVDNIGHVETAQTCTVRIDTARPTTKAPYRASVRRNHRVTLKYKVVDPLPNSGKAKARIIIRNKNGRIVARLAWRTVTVNELKGWRYFCKLKPGTYRFSVYATDLAGNKQVKVGSNRLIVR